MALSGLGTLGICLIAFAILYAVIPWVIGRLILYFCPSITAWKFLVFCTLFVISLIVVGTWLVLVALNAEEAKELALTGENDIGIAYGGLEMLIIIADVIGLPVGVWFGLFAWKHRSNEEEDARK